MQKKINRLRGHTIVCGFGRMGAVICKELVKSHKNFVVIENSEKHIHHLEMTNYLWIEGDATKDEVLTLAGIEKGANFLAMLDNDGDNLYLSLAARSLNPDIQIVARSESEAAKRKILRAGANKVILPLHMSAIKVAQSVLNPTADDFLNISGVTEGDNSDSIQLAEIEVKNNSVLIGQDLSSCGLKREHIIVVGIKSKDHSFVFAPDSSYKFQEGDRLITLSKTEEYKNIVKKLISYGVGSYDHSKDEDIAA